MKEVVIAITAASYSGNKGAAAMLQSSIRQLYEKYGTRLKINLMSVYPEEDKEQIRGILSGSFPVNRNSFCLSRFRWQFSIKYFIFCLR